MTFILTDSDQTNRNSNNLPRPVTPSHLPQLRAYWEGLRVDDAIPTRSQITPRGIEDALSCTYLLERVAPGIARFRIAGMDLADLMGMEVRGLPFSSLFCPSGRAQLATKLEAVFQSPAILTMDLTAERGLIRPNLSARLLMMPLCDDRGHVTMALGCLSLNGKIGRSPRRFDVTGATLSPLAAPRKNRRETLHDCKPALAPMGVSKSRQLAFAETATTFASGKSGKSTPYLRVIK